ncbi:MAG: hypothetical protein V4659_09140 [Pseudomonadota bacterium]
MRISWFALPCLLIGCSGAAPDGGKAQEIAKRDAKAANGGFVPPSPQPLETVRVDPIDAPAPGAILPPATQQYRYIGAWASNPALCKGGAWRFTTRGLKTAGEISCDLPDVATIPTGFKLAGTCQAEHRKVAETIDLSFDTRAKTMRVKSQMLFPTIDLIYCGA